MLKLSSTVELVDLVREETQVVSTNLPIVKVFQIPHASNTLPPILTPTVVKPLISAKTAPGHHAQPTRHVKINAGPSSTHTTMLPTTTALVVLPR